MIDFKNAEVVRKAKKVEESIRELLKHATLVELSCLVIIDTEHKSPGVLQTLTKGLESCLESLSLNKQMLQKFPEVFSETRIVEEVDKLISRLNTCLDKVKELEKKGEKS